MTYGGTAMRVHVHSPGGPRPDRGPRPGLAITEGLAALILLVGLIAGVAAAVTWATVLGFTYLAH
jgi:ATP-dependent Lon protease